MEIDKYLLAAGRLRQYPRARTHHRACFLRRLPHCFADSLPQTSDIRALRGGTRVEQTSHGLYSGSAVTGEGFTSGQADPELNHGPAANGTQKGLS